VIGWNALPQTSVKGEQSPQDLAIVSWYEICSDAGMRFEQYTPCYRAAQQRKRELLSQGQQLSIVTPHDLCAELERVRRMHAELDESRLLPENAATACQRCFGTGKEEMPDESVRDGCEHLPLSPDEIKERAKIKAQKIAHMLEEAKKIGSPKPVARPVEQPKGTPLMCSDCKRKTHTAGGWQVGETCGVMVGESDNRRPCEGRMIERKER
jgi:hypothetical protein